jgi:hypothetical protein
MKKMTKPRAPTMKARVQALEDIIVELSQRVERLEKPQDIAADRPIGPGEA